jgi:SAM-dependent methyltransferase
VSTTGERDGYWDDPDRVAEFAAREVDHRLREILDALPEGTRLRVLDLGCAGGRNTRPLAERGHDVVALDAAPAMVERTRADLVPILGAGEAERRVRLGRMDDLSFAEDAAFDLVVALGVYHMAGSEAELSRALGETRRVLAPAGRVLIAIFGPGTRFGSRVYRPVPGTRYVHEDPEGDRACLLREADLDAEMARVGLSPLVPTATVRREGDDVLRVVVNGLYGTTDG